MFSGGSWAALLQRINTWAAAQTFTGNCTFNGQILEGTKRIFADGCAKAWVNFNASSGTPVVNSNFNVPSITDNGVGDFTINFTTAFANTNYIMLGRNDNVAGANRNATPDPDVHTKATNSCRIYIHDASSVASDWVENEIIFFGVQ